MLSLAIVARVRIDRSESVLVMVHVRVLLRIAWLRLRLRLGLKLMLRRPLGRWLLLLLLSTWLLWWCRTRRILVGSIGRSFVVRRAIRRPWLLVPAVPCVPGVFRARVRIVGVEMAIIHKIRVHGRNIRPYRR